MKHAYLIMAHNQWGLLGELLRIIDDPRNDIYLHIDKKVSAPLSDLKSCVQKSNLYLTKRYNIVWGGSQMMECTISMLEQASTNTYERYHFISGVDFPIKSQDEIHGYFNQNRNLQYVGIDWSGIKSGRFLGRAQYYHYFINIIGKRDEKSLCKRLLTRLEDFSLLIQKKSHVNRLNYTMYKGSSWFSITHTAVVKILDAKKQILKRYRYTANSDEIWLQTFMMETELSDQLADSNLRYIKWVQGNPSPETLTMMDYETLICSDKLFARKFNLDTDGEIIMKIKEKISQ